MQSHLGFYSNPPIKDCSNDLMLDHLSSKDTYLSRKYSTKVYNYGLMQVDLGLNNVNPSIMDSCFDSKKEHSCFHDSNPLTMDSSFDPMQGHSGFNDSNPSSTDSSCDLMQGRSGLNDSNPSTKESRIESLQGHLDRQDCFGFIESNPLAKESCLNSTQGCSGSSDWSNTSDAESDETVIMKLRESES